MFVGWLYIKQAWKVTLSSVSQTLTKPLLRSEMHQCCPYYTDKTFCLIRWGHASQEVEGFLALTFNIDIKDSFITKPPVSSFKTSTTYFAEFAACITKISWYMTKCTIVPSIHHTSNIFINIKSAYNAWQSTFFILAL